MTTEAYHRPTRLAEVLALAGQHPGARFIAGGTDLLVQMKKRRLEAPAVLISLRNVRELTAIEVAGGELSIGAGASLSEVLAHPAVREGFPALAEALLAMGSHQIRNVATLGGNLANASPAADAAPPLLVHDASIELLASNASVRRVPLSAFFVGPGKTVMLRSELIRRVIVPRAGSAARAVFFRKGRVRMDLAMVSLAAALDFAADGTIAAARLAAGSVAPVPLRLRAAESTLIGARPDEQRLQAAVEAAQAAITPIDDLRSTAAYRRHLLGVFVRRALVAIIAAQQESVR